MKKKKYIEYVKIKLIPIFYYLKFKIEYIIIFLNYF